MPERPDMPVVDVEQLADELRADLAARAAQGHTADRGWHDHRADMSRLTDAGIAAQDRDLVAQQGWTVDTAQHYVAGYTNPDGRDYVYIGRTDPPPLLEAIADIRADIELGAAIDRAEEEARCAGLVDDDTDDRGEVLC